MRKSHFGSLSELEEFERDMEDRTEAIEMQDKLREKSGKWNATEFIRRWRDERKI